MKPLFITAAVTFSGKTALTLGLGLELQTSGHKIGYFKPISTQPFRSDAELTDEDADFARHIFNLSASAHDLAPIVFDDALLESVLSGTNQRNFAEEIKAAYERLSTNTDVLLIEGGASLRDGSLIGLNPINLADSFNWPTLGVVRYRDDLKLLDDALSLKYRLDKHLLGIVINDLPTNVMTKINQKIAPYLEQHGVRVYGLLPQDQSLRALTVQELIEVLDAQVLTRSAYGTALVENLSVGAMSVEAALPRFRRMLNKAVITGGDRADIQAAALETSTVALILTGNLQPNPAVIQRADELGVAALMVSTNTIDTVEAIEKIFGKTRLGHPEKLERFRTLVETHLDTKRLFADMGLSL